MPETIDLTARQATKQNEFRQRIAGLLLTGDAQDASDAYWILQYVRLLGGLPITK